MHRINFELKYEPTDLKQISRWPYWFGILLLLFSLLVLMLGKDLPTEMQIFYIHEIVGKFLFHLNALGILSVILGLILGRLSWRKGELVIEENDIRILGKKSVNVPFETIKKILKMNESNRFIQIDTTHYNIKMRFKSIDGYKEVEGLLNDVLELE